ncbi:PREDICTED: TOM1-like protein 2 isoform X2 [Galeopterus variegatus]|uniref:TOM1-like protein 2 isoform X2 n=1 Tax=Galeopterus variegatus TaxID=482537 RepID=A0ABM0Q7W2_GALVR|nr:PREDICTED: TOM1-like protein 2 isoform X2 [Galeopterus variegatus]
MEFLLGNPFSTPVGQCLEKATDGSLQSEDWTLNMEICDIINETEEGPKDAIRALKKRLNGNRNYREVMLALTVLETCVKNCGHRFHILVANRDFIDSVLVKIISPRNNPPTIVQDKVLALIQAWADAFRSSPDLTGVVHIYEELKRKGVEFPMADLDALSPIHTPQRSVPEVDPAATMPRSQSQQRTSTSSYSSPPPAPYSSPQAPALSVTGPITANSEQIARLRSELDVVRGNTKVMSEMLTEMVPGQEDSSDLELLQELNRTCRAMQQRIVELISRVSNEEVTEELLHVNDDLNNVFLRYERFERYRSGRSVQNASNGVLNEVTEDNLIDLGPGSPAVVSPMVGSTAPPSSLSSQLAGLDLGTESVSGTLSSLQQCNPHDGFDMFAQTRGNSLAEQRKTVTYEDPQAVGGLTTALDSRKQSSEMIPVAQPSVMDDIEVWLRTDLVRLDFYILCVGCGEAEALLRTGLQGLWQRSRPHWRREFGAGTASAASSSSQLTLLSSSAHGYMWRPAVMGAGSGHSLSPPHSPAVTSMPVRAELLFEPSSSCLQNTHLPSPQFLFNFQCMCVLGFFGGWWEMEFLFLCFCFCKL